MQAIRQSVADDFEAVNALIIQELHSDVGLVESIGHYIVDAGGKRIRPLLVLLMAGAIGKIDNSHRQFSAVVEFIHTATLLHDDVVDVSTLRRGRETANAKWGNAPSVLVGDFIYSRAFQLMVRMGNLDIMRLMADTTNLVAEGEVLQLENAGNPDTSEHAYFEVIKRKTAALFQAATEGAALLSGLTPEGVAACKNYGYHLGMAFQLIDDMLDYSGKPEQMGKHIGDDLAEGKPTLPLIRVMQVASDNDAALVRQAISQKSAVNIDRISMLIKQSDALDYTRAAALRHRSEAVEALQQLPRTALQHELERLLELAIDRNA
jgi:octaprenyl-diphosphate synthase